MGFVGVHTLLQTLAMALLTSSRISSLCSVQVWFLSLYNVLGAGANIINGFTVLASETNELVALI